MQLLIGLVFCNEKVKVRHGTIFFLILAKKAGRLEMVLHFFVVLAKFGISSQRARVVPGSLF